MLNHIVHHVVVEDALGIDDQVGLLHCGLAEQCLQLIGVGVFVPHL